MPEYIISATGGNFTDATTWDGGVVPPSATASDIIGLSTSGPLLFNNLGNRNIGSLELSQYQSSIGFTGSSTNLGVFGVTFSLGPSMSWNGNVGSGTITNQTIGLRGCLGATQNVITNGIAIRNQSFRITPQNNAGLIALHDTLKLNSISRMDFDNGVNTGYVVGSLTASQRAIIEIDPENVSGAIANGTYMIFGQINVNSKGYFVEFKSVPSSTSALNFGEEIYPGQSRGLMTGCVFNVVQGNFRIERGFVLGPDSTFRQTGGTIQTGRTGADTLPRLITIYTYMGTNSKDVSLSESNVYIDTPNFTWDNLTIAQNYFNTSEKTGVVNLLGTFSVVNTTIEYQPESLDKDAKVRFVGTQSSVDLGNLIFTTPYLCRTGVFTHGFSYRGCSLEFMGGLTYSIKSLMGASSYLEGKNGGITNGNLYKRIGGTQGTANIVLTSNAATTRWFDYEDINVSGYKIYELGGGTLTNTTGVESSLPTGGTGSGGGEVSYTFLS